MIILREIIIDRSEKERKQKRKRKLIGINKYLEMCFRQKEEKEEE